MTRKQEFIDSLYPNIKLNNDDYKKILGYAYSDTDFLEVVKDKVGSSIDGYYEWSKEYEREMCDLTKGTSKVITENTTKELDKVSSTYNWKAKFHKFKRTKSGDLIPCGVIDEYIVRDIIENTPLFILFGKIYLYKEGVYIIDEKGNRLKAIIKRYLYDDFIKARMINGIFELLLMEPSLNIKIDMINNYPKHWINFKDGMLDVTEMKMHKHDPKYLSINQIPWKLPNSDVESRNGKITEQFIGYLIKDDSDRDTLFEYLGYCMTTLTRYQKFLVLKGAGRTGKGTLLRIIQKILGVDNYSSVSLNNLSDNKFAAVDLLGKIVNICGDLPAKAIENTSVIKGITGEDTIEAEYKYGDRIKFRPYSKLLFSANKMPVTLDEQTNAFYDRLLIIATCNQSEVVKIDNIEEKLESEIGYIILRALLGLKRLIEDGKFIESTSNKVEVERLYSDSDTVFAFLMENTYKHATGQIERGKLYQEYESYCKNPDIERTPLSKKNFYTNMRDKGYVERRLSNGRFFCGIALNQDDTSFHKGECPVSFSDR